MKVNALNKNVKTGKAVTVKQVVNLIGEQIKHWEDIYKNSGNYDGALVKSVLQELLFQIETGNMIDDMVYGDTVDYATIMTGAAAKELNDELAKNAWETEKKELEQSTDIYLHEGLEPVETAVVDYSLPITFIIVDAFRMTENGTHAPVNGQVFRTRKQAQKALEALRKRPLHISRFTGLPVDRDTYVVSTSNKTVNV